MMGARDAAWRQSPSRRKALASLAGVLAGSPLLPATLRAQLDPRSLAEHRRAPSLSEMVTAFDFEPIAFANLPQQLYDFTAHGDGSEFTLRRNRQAFEWFEVVPAGPSIDPGTVDLSMTLLGTPMAYPILVAPTAAQVPLHPDGEIGMHAGATAAADTPMIVSHNTSIPIEKVAAGATGPLWFQFYPTQNLESGRPILDRAHAAGCAAIVVTVDQQASYYERTQRNRHLGGTERGPGRGGGPPAAAAQAITGAARYGLSTRRLWYSWAHLAELRKMIPIPLVVKGILTAEDARLSVEHGMDAIVVSNHGGRSMDYGPSTLEVLPEIVAAVAGRMPIIIDSGFRRGTDVLTALAIGADAVLLGRATRWGLAAFGAPGAQRVLEIVQRELVEAAAAAGAATRGDCKHRLRVTRRPG
jgi:isopentenyl diphosphate isomerase/L-lactate dehydrogenase-like FMN-dependent dehydrogenase